VKRQWALLALALPILVFVLAIVRAERHISEGEVFRFSIAGYDPRDLLRGHYLQFSVAYDWQEDRGVCEVGSGDDCCLCLMGTGNSPPSVVRSTCEAARTQCDGAVLQSEIDELDRYYVPESQARQAELFLQARRSSDSAFIVVSITSEGKVQIIDLVIDGESLDDLLAQPSE
jgi:uncharacterized membrane-anchored protein